MPGVESQRRMMPAEGANGGAVEVTCDLLIRSYWKDLAWLELCLASIRRFCRGFRRVILVLPGSSRPWLRRSAISTADITIVFCAEYADDYLGQQVTKLMADHYSDADFICHVDADCIFARPCTPEQLIVAGRPRIVVRTDACADRHWPWRQPTEQFLRWPVREDFMQQPPFVFPGWLYHEVREFSLQTHHIDLETYVISQPPRGFSEFNVLAAFAFRHHHDRFLWLDRQRRDLPPPFCRWYWSWQGVDAHTRSEIQALLSNTPAHDGDASNSHQPG